MSLDALALLRDSGAPWEDADPATFRGPARIKRLGGAGTDPDVKAYRVRFEPGARTSWHTHSGPQVLVVVEGRCRVQRWGGPVEVAEAGDVVVVAPGEKHWHGAGREGATTHVAINVGATTDWLEAAPDPGGDPT